MPKVTNSKVHVGAYHNLLKRVRSKASASEKNVRRVIDSVDNAQSALSKAADKLDDLENVLHELRGIVHGSSHLKEYKGKPSGPPKKKSMLDAKTKDQKYYKGFGDRSTMETKSSAGGQWVDDQWYSQGFINRLTDDVG